MVVMKAISNYVLKFYMKQMWCAQWSSPYWEIHYMWHWLTGVGSLQKVFAEPVLYEMNCSFSTGRGALAQSLYSA